MNFDKLYNLLMEEKEKVITVTKQIEIPINYTGKVIWPSEVLKGLFIPELHEWYENGEWHRTNGPARIFFGKLHNNARCWYIHGQRHREDGPAIERDNGNNEYFLNDKQYTEQNYKRELIRQGIIKDPSLSDVMDAI